MLPHRISAINDNFECRTNTRSTPKKMHNNEYNDKRVSVDIMYSELLKLKDDTNNSFMKSSNTTAKIASEMSQARNEISTLTHHHESSNALILDIEKRLLGLETVVEKYGGLREDYDRLKIQVNGLSNEVTILKRSKEDSLNSMEQLVQSNLTESLRQIKISIDENMNVINKILIENPMSSTVPSRSGILTLPETETTNVEPKVNMNDSKTFVSNVATKSAILVKPATPLKTKDDSSEKNTEKPKAVESIKVQSVTNVEQNKLEEKANLSFGIKDQTKPMVNITNKTPEKNSIVTPSSQPKEAVKPQSGFFSNLKFDVPPPSDKGLTGIFGLSTPKPATNLTSSPQGPTTTLFGKSNQPQTNLFGNINQDKSQTSLFSGKPSSDKPITNLFGATKTEIPKSNLFGSKTENPSSNLFGQDKTEKPQNSLFGNNPNLFGQKPSDKSQSNLFGTPSGSEKSTNLFSNNSDKPLTSIFTSLPTTQPTTLPFNVDKSDKPSIPNTIFGANSNNPSFSFSSTSDKNAAGFGSTTEVNWKQGSKLFSTPTNKPAENHDESNEHNAEEEEHDPHFQPIIELPPLVAIATDEDSHDVLFKNRCKLYRWINNEWKERGVGEMKILQTKAEVDPTRPVKLLMRRDQVRKICCNQRVTKFVPAFADMQNAKSACWVGNDFSEGEANQEKFAIRFGSEDLMTEFKNKITKIQEQLGSEDKTN